MKSEWIPVTERLPEKEGWYLISMGDEWDEDKTNNLMLGRVKDPKKIYPSNVRISKFEDGHFYHGMVAAWQEVPKPYFGSDCLQ